MSLTGSSRWIVAVICSALNFLHLGTARLSGTMYLAVLERYHVDRSKASLPFILCYTVRNISGPLVGYLSTKFGIYTVTMLGGLIAFVGIGGCFFAEDIVVVILCWGVVFGFGFGMGSVLIPEILNQHFDKYVSNANGIAFGGECIAGFVLPIFLKFSFNTYGTSGTFLILSGLMLNSIPVTLLLKHFSHCQAPEQHQRTQSQEHSTGENGLHCSINGANNDSFEIEDCDMPLVTTALLAKKESYPKSSEIKEFPSVERFSIMGKDEINKSNFNVKNSNFNRNIYLDVSKEHLLPDLKMRTNKRNCPVNRYNAKVYKKLNIQTRKSDCQDSKASTSKDIIFHSYPGKQRKCSYAFYSKINIPNHSKTENQYASMKYYGSLDREIQKFGNLSEELSSLPELPITSTNEKSSDNLYKHSIKVTLPNISTSYLTASSPEQTSPSNPFKIFLDPVFCVILLTQSTMLYNVTLVWTVIVDFSRDSGLSSREEIYVLIFFSVLDMIGRLGLGWFTDAGCVSNSTFSGVCCFGMGISVGALVFFREVAAIGSSMSLFGLCLGGFLIVCPGVVNDHIQPDMRGMALASRLFLFAPMSLSQSPLIGYFREKLGSYNSIFIIVAVLCIFSCFMSLLTPYAEKFRERRHKNNGILGRNVDAFVSTASSIEHLTNEMKVLLK
ncbi:uncharacterized protein LOC129987486 isoform X1 [Argiope bruennichi]|uniref:uncharacterized protein LOC129987486 isoform X1 n=1 Tax=Argiope bruennichi TaxID=94029 RepID=UPI0024957E0E|nr:uncharacterized protein LOC129987486 isoform X1 [Argiope bruennichi]